MIVVMHVTMDMVVMAPVDSIEVDVIIKSNGNNTAILTMQ